VICSRDPGDGLQYEFQRKVGQLWRKELKFRFLGPARSLGVDHVTITRYVKFTKAGSYHWRCRAGSKGTWSLWSPAFTIAAPAAQKTRTPARSTAAPDRDIRTGAAD